MDPLTIILIILAAAILAVPVIFLLPVILAIAIVIIMVLGALVVFLCFGLYQIIVWPFQLIYRYLYE